MFASDSVRDHFTIMGTPHPIRQPYTTNMLNTTELQINKEQKKEKETKFVNILRQKSESSPRESTQKVTNDTQIDISEGWFLINNQASGTDVAARLMEADLIRWL